MPEFLVPWADPPFFSAHPHLPSVSQRDSEDVALRLAEQLEQSRRRELVAKDEIVRLRGSLARAEEAAKQALCLSEPSAGGALARRAVRAEQAADGAIGVARAAERETGRLRVRNGELKVCLDRSQERLEAALSDQRSLARRLGELEAALGGPAAAQRRLAQIGRERSHAAVVHGRTAHSSGAKVDHVGARSSHSGPATYRSEPAHATFHGGRGDATNANAPARKVDEIGIRVVFVDGSHGEAGGGAGGGERESGETGESVVGGRSLRSVPSDKQCRAASDDGDARSSEHAAKLHQRKSRVKSVRYDDRVCDDREEGASDEDFAIPAGRRHPIEQAGAPPMSARKLSRNGASAQALFDVQFGDAVATTSIPPARRGALKKGSPARARDRLASVLSSLTESARNPRVENASEERLGCLKTARGRGTSAMALGLATARATSFGLKTARGALGGTAFGLKTARGAATPGLTLRPARGSGAALPGLRTARGRLGELKTARGLAGGLEVLKSPRGVGLGALKSSRGSGYGATLKTTRGPSQNAWSAEPSSTRSSGVTARIRCENGVGIPEPEDPGASPPLYGDVPQTLRPAALDALKRIHADARRAKALRNRPVRLSTSPAGLAEPWTALLLAPAGLSAVANAAGRNADDAIMRERKALKAWKLVCTNANSECVAPAAGRRGREKARAEREGQRREDVGRAERSGE